MTDKRSVFTDALETLGTIIDENQKRDAIHLAVEPVVAKECLNPGEHVTADGRSCIPYSDVAVGIVDPFLNIHAVVGGERFWLVLYPRTIKSLRHVWEHPAFPPSEVQVVETPEEINAKIEASKKWIEDYVSEIHKWDNENRDYYDLMAAADKWVSSDYDAYLYFSVDNKSLNEEFWHHYEIVTGKKVEEGKKRNFFACSC